MSALSGGAPASGLDPLRILHTESSFGWGGQEIRVLTEARGVARAGNEVVIAAPAAARIYREAPHYGIETVALPIGRKAIGGMLGLREFLARRPFDVVNSHSSTDSWLAAIACATLKRSPALVRTRHISASAPRNLATRWLYARAAARVVTTGERLRAQVIAETGADPKRVVSIPTGIDLERFRAGDRRAERSRLDLAGDAKIVGIVATLRDWKGHRSLLQAIASLKRKDTLLLIVGDGPQRHDLESFARELDLSARVRFVGEQTDVPTWLRAMDIFCLPSYANEGVPQALMQAMACALPVVTTSVGSIGEIVTDGVNGVLVPAENAARLAQALDALFDDEARRGELGARAAAFARERFGEALMVERMVHLFRELATEARGRTL